MKRSPLKRTRMKRSPQGDTAKAKKAGWDWFSRFIRLRGSRTTCEGIVVNDCFTCGRPHPLAMLDAGHFKPGRGNAILYSEEGTNPQCRNCNRTLYGNQQRYREVMLFVHGLAVVEELERLARSTHEMTAMEHRAMAAKYKGMVDGLGGWPE